jgi:multidrug efflux pump subunit AcrA (membrane-fusion protein)
MSTRVEVEDIETTKSEKLLAFVLAAFFLIGGLWIYFQPLDRYDENARYLDYGSLGSKQDRAAIDAHDRARHAFRRARRSELGQRQKLELAREAYRTALEAGQDASGLEQSYRDAQTALTDAQTRTGAQERALQAAAPAAKSASARISAAEHRRAARVQDREHSQRRAAFLLRLTYVLITLAAGYVLLGRLRRRHSRYLPVGLAFVGFASAQGLVMATDYMTDYIDVFEIGPLVLSLVGTALTLTAFVALQRYLAQRLPERRVRRRECPFCGFPVATDHCEGCGRQVIAECAVCSGRRRVGTAHCASCGAA